MNLSITHVKGLIGKYPVGNFLAFEKIKEQGFMNHMFLVKTDQGKFVLRVSKNTKSKKDLLFEINLLHSLHNLPVPNYIRGNDGQYLHRFQGKYYSFYKYLPGNMPPQLTPLLRREMAFFLAKFHTQTKNFNNNQQRFAWYTFTTARANELERQMLPKLQNYKEEIQYLESMILKNRLPTGLPRGPIHVDIRRENSLAIGNILTGIVDFDNCQIGPYILDLAMSIAWICTKEGHLNYKRTYQFVKCYERYRTLNGFEKKNLFKAIKYAYATQVFVNHYVYTQRLVTKKHFHFGRRNFLTALKNLSPEQFSKQVF